MSATLWAWEGVADAEIAGLVPAGVGACSLVYQLASGATGFEREGGEACLLALGEALVHVSAAGAERLRGGTAIATLRKARPRAWLFVDPTTALDAALDALHAWSRAEAVHALARRFGREHTCPEPPPLATLVSAPTQASIVGALTLTRALVIAQHGGAWGLYLTCLGGPLTLAPRGVAVRRVADRASLPQW